MQQSARVAYVLTLDNWHPVRTNQWYGAHWRVRHRLKKDQSAVLALERINAGIPRAESPRRVRVEVYGWPGRRALPDPDAFDKLLRDGLKDAGLVVDDSRQWLPFYEVILLRANDRKTVIMVEDCEHG